jgi:isopenicillin N synthase-like dioxygenase
MLELPKLSFMSFPCMFWQIVTNGIYRSIEHRATVNSVKERLSMATFYSPRLDGDMGPAPSLITPESPALFKRIGVVDYFRGYFSRKFDGKSYIDVMRVQNEE